MHDPSSQPSPSSPSTDAPEAMPKEVIFDREFAAYGTGLTAIERDPAVSNLLMEILGEWAYPVSALIGARVTTLDLSPDRANGLVAKGVELMFALSGQNYVEIVTYAGPGEVQYCGWLMAGKRILITDEIINDFSVIEVILADGTQVRHQYVSGFGYEPVPGIDAVPLYASRRVRMRHRL